MNNNNKYSTRTAYFVLAVKKFYVVGSVGGHARDIPHFKVETLGYPNWYSCDWVSKFRSNYFHHAVGP